MRFFCVITHHSIFNQDEPWAASSVAQGCQKIGQPWGMPVSKTQSRFLSMRALPLSSPENGRALAGAARDLHSSAFLAALTKFCS